MEAPNAVWTTDYKGQFKLGNGQYCFPLTVADGYGRRLLACQALTSTRTSSSLKRLQTMAMRRPAPAVLGVTRVIRPSR